jgi:hypothetical protein
VATIKSRGHRLYQRKRGGRQGKPRRGKAGRKSGETGAFDTLSLLRKSALKSGGPSILVASLDYEEAVHFLCCRASSANYPCPRCMVHHSELRKMSGKYTRRTSKTMSAVLKQARAQPTATVRNEILASYGLHNTKVNSFIHSLRRITQFYAAICLEIPADGPVPFIPLRFSSCR